MKFKTWYGKIILFLILIIFYYLLFVYLQFKISLKNIANEFDCKANVDSILYAIANQFEISSSREETYQMIIEIDPSLERILGDGYSCNQNTNYCNEHVYFFRDRFPNSFGIYFLYTYDEENLLKDVIITSW